MLTRKNKKTRSKKERIEIMKGRVKEEKREERERVECKRYKYCL